MNERTEFDLAAPAVDFGVGYAPETRFLHQGPIAAEDLATFQSHLESRMPWKDAWVVTSVTDEGNGSATVKGYWAHATGV